MPTVPMIQNPAPPPAEIPVVYAIAWYRSQRFIALCQSTALIVIGWLSAALATNDWSWRPMAIAVLGNVLIALKDWWNPNIAAPFAVLNTNNVGPVKP